MMLLPEGNIVVTTISLMSHTLIKAHLVVNQPNDIACRVFISLIL